MNRIGPYLIERILSTGGMSTLFLGRHHRLGRPVAVKQLHPHLTGDHSLVKRFEREARILAGLHHPNIVDILDFFQHQGSYYIVLEYIEGRSLKELLSQRSPLPLVSAAYIGEQVAQGLRYAHSRGVVHRDIKPANIMFTESGGVKITDFGLAFVKEAMTLTDPGTFFGTPAYLAPEQIRGQSGDERSDLFSLGILLYEMLSGSNPFQGESPSQCLDRILRHRPERLSARGRTIPPRLEALIFSLLEKEPERRPGSAQEAARRLEPYIFFNADGLSRLLADPKEFRPRQEDEAAWQDLARREKGAWLGTRILLAASATAMIALIGWYAYNRVLPAIPKNLSPPAPPSESSASDSSVAALPNPDIVVSQAPARLKISGTTGAKISLNGKEQGNIPLSLEGLAPGRYLVRAELSGFETREQRVRIDPGRDKELTFNLRPLELAPGYLQLTVSPWAEVFIDGRFVDRTPLAIPLSLEPGRRQLLLRHPNRLEYIQDLSIASRETLRLTVRMPEAWGYLRLTVNPWAEVFIDGQSMGTTPLAEDLKLSIGEHELKLRGPDGREQRETIRILRDDTLRHRVDLAP